MPFGIKRRITEEPWVKGYIKWNEVFWDSFQAGYVKNLDIEFFFSLKSAIARRLYRLLDKQFYNKDYWERDIFELASRLGMARYSKPSWVKRKLQPGIDELIDRGYLLGVEVVKVKKYTRLRFVKSLAAEEKRCADAGLRNENEQEKQREYILQQQEEKRAQWLLTLRERYGGPTALELDLWPKVLSDLELQMTKQTFDSNLTNSLLLTLRDNQATVGLKDQYAQEWAEGRLKPTIQRTLANHLDGRQVELQFIIL
jgi:plasmid replication initiation protein